MSASDVLSRSWQTVKKNLWPCIGTTLLVYFTMMAAQQCLSLIGTCLVMGPCFGGLYYYFIKQLRGEPAILGDAFLGFKKPHWGQLALCSTVQLLITAVLGAILIGPAFFIFPPKFLGNGSGAARAFSGFVWFDFSPPLLAWCFVAAIPIMYLTMSWMLSYAFIFDKGLRFWPAMELSRKLVNMRLGGWIVLMLVNALLACAGIMALCVGVIFVLPVTLCAFMVVYEDILSLRAPSNT